MPSTSQNITNSQSLSRETGSSIKNKPMSKI